MITMTVKIKISRVVITWFTTRLLRQACFLYSSSAFIANSRTTSTTSWSGTTKYCHSFKAKGWIKGIYKGYHSITEICLINRGRCVVDSQVHTRCCRCSWKKLFHRLTRSQRLIGFTQKKHFAYGTKKECRLRQLWATKAKSMQLTKRIKA